MPRECFEGTRGCVEAKDVGFGDALLEKPFGQEVSGAIRGCAGENTGVGGGIEELTDGFYDDDGFTRSRTRYKE